MIQHVTHCYCLVLVPLVHFYCNKKYKYHKKMIILLYYYGIKEVMGKRDLTNINNIMYLIYFSICNNCNLY